MLLRLNRKKLNYIAYIDDYNFFLKEMNFNTYKLKIKCGK